MTGATNCSEPAGNEVNRRIKQSMLNFPSIMPSRLAVLTQLFLANGNGMDWKDGRLVDRHPSDVRDTMNFSDLDEREAEVVMEMSSLEGSSMREFLQVRKIGLDRERMVRQHIADNIDLYAANHVMGDDVIYNAEWLRHIDPHWTALSPNNFPNVMRPDWAAAAEEITRIARNSLWRDLGMYSEHFNEGKADPAKLEKYKGFCAILERLDQFTGWKERERHHDALMSDVIAELKAEAAAEQPLP